MDAPFLVDRREVEHDGGMPVIGSMLIASQRSLVCGRSVLGEFLAERAHPFVILVEMLPAGERSPRKVQVDVLPERDVGDLIVFGAGPIGRREGLARLDLKVEEGELIAPMLFRELLARNAALLLDEIPAVVGKAAVGLGRDAHDHIGCRDIRIHLRTTLGNAFLHRAVELGQLFDLLIETPFDATIAAAVL